MKIGEVAAAARVSTRALRYYEEHGLLSAERSPGGQRVYPAKAVARVRLIQQLYAAGLASRAIAELLPCVHTGVATPTQLTMLAAERDRIDLQVAELAEARERLDAVITAAAASAAGTHCPLAAGGGAPDGDLCEVPVR